MQANVRDIDGKAAGSVKLPEVFETAYREDVVKRALLAEQSRRYQPQGRDLLAGLRTSAEYVGRMNTYRSRRHSGGPPRPRQQLAGGALGDVRRIPSAKKGRRAHPQKTEKVIVERINRKEYVLALRSAVAATANAELINNRFFNGTLPIVVSSGIEKIAKAKELMKAISALGLEKEVAASHTPRIDNKHRRKVEKRHFRKSVLIVAKNSELVERAGRNIPGVDVADVGKLSISLLAPGAKPRLTMWSQAALDGLEEALQKSKVVA